MRIFSAFDSTLSVCFESFVEAVTSTPFGGVLSLRTKLLRRDLVKLLLLGLDNAEFDFVEDEVVDPSVTAIRISQLNT